MILKQQGLFRYRVGYIRRGVRHWVTEYRSNLILDSGLNLIATTGWVDAFNFCLFGNQVSPTPVQRNGGGVTFSQSTTTITASGGFFTSQDTGRLFKFDSGEECYLTFVDSTHATASISRTVGSGPGTVWYVNQTALQSLFSATSTYGAGGGDNGTTAASNVVTHQRTFTGAAVGAPVTLTEIGFNNSASNSSIFDRDIIVGGVALIAGDIPLAVCQLIVTYDQTTPQAVGNVGTGFDSSGNFQVCSLGIGNNGSNIQWVKTDGSTGGTFFNAPALEPSNKDIGAVYTATFSLPSFTSGTGSVIAASVAGTSVLQSYSAGNFYRDTITSFSISQANGSIYGIANQTNPPGWAQLLTTPFTKLGTQTLVFTTRKLWQRILTN